MRRRILVNLASRKSQQSRPLWFRLFSCSYALSFRFGSALQSPAELLPQRLRIELFQVKVHFARPLHVSCWVHVRLKRSAQIILLCELRQLYVELRLFDPCNGSIGFFACSFFLFKGGL